MKQLEKAARAMREHDRANAPGQWNSWERAKPEHRQRYLDRARAVIASIEPHDAMVEAAAREGFAVRCKTNGPRVLAEYAGQDIMRRQHEDARVIISAFLRALLAEGEGR